MASKNPPRDIQSSTSKSKTKLTLLNVLDESFNLSVISPKRRRQTIHGREIKKIKHEADLNDSRRLTRSSSITNVSSPASTSSSTMMTLPNRHTFLPGVIKGTLKRRVSTSLLRHKMKKLQDYSLAPTAQDLAIFKDTCNITTRSSPRGCNSNNNNRPLPTSTPVPPAKPPRQRPPKNSTSFAQRQIMTPVSNENNSPVWKRRDPGIRNQTRRKDQDLQQKIDHEIKMREGTARLLVASKHPAQVLEAAKNLMSSNTRIMAYMTELQRRKTAEVLGKQACLEGNQVPCRAQVSVSDIRIPLMWKDTDHFKNKGDYRSYAVFCLLKVGTDIYDTSMISGVDRSMTDITFEDVILFEEVPHDFEMQLEVYCHKQHEELSVANTPKKIRKKITDLSGSVGRSVGKRLSGLNDADVIGNMVLGPKFELVAKGSLKLSNVDSSVKTFDLQLEANSEGNFHELPLFGHYCCRLAALPSCLVQATVSGFLNLQEEDDNLTQWRRYWCSLKNLQIACWSSPDDVEVTKPLLRIPVTKSTQISDADPSTCKQAHTFLIKTVNTEGIFDHTLAADSKEELNRWWDGLQQHLLDQAFWKHACDEQMDLKTVSKRKVPSFVRKSSIYDETPLIDPDSQTDSLVGDLGLGDDQLSQMLHQLMGEASQIRGGGGGGSCSSTSS